MLLASAIDELWSSTSCTGPPSAADEARFLTAILNSTALLECVRPLQNRGLFVPRDFDTYVFQVPIPTYDRNSELHAQLVTLGAEAEQVAAAVSIDGRSPQAARREIANALAEHGVAARIEAAVREVLTIQP